MLSGKKTNGGFDVKIFTPFVGVPFAGHSVLGTSFIIDKYFDIGAREIKLNLACAQIPVLKEGNLYAMSQNQPSFLGMVVKEDIAKALSIPVESIHADYPAQCISTGLESVIIALK